MLVSLSSGNYDIVASGQAFLFSKDKDLRIDIQADNGFAFSLILNFICILRVNRSSFTDK